MAKIYVSSTYQDLTAYRRQVGFELRRMGHTDVAMEYYLADARPPVEKCLADVAQCDLYVILVAWRYGWIPEQPGPDRLSITHMEYRQAVASGKTCLPFLAKKDNWPFDLVELDRLAEVEQLRAELARNHLAASFSSVEDLGTAVVHAVRVWEQTSLARPEAPAAGPSDPAPYFRAVRRRYVTLDLDALTPPEKEAYLRIRLPDVFVEPYVREEIPQIELPGGLWERLQRTREIHPDDLPEGFSLDPASAGALQPVPTEAALQPALEALADTARRKKIVLGQPGSGKSTLMRYVLLALVDPDGDARLRRAYDGCLPLLVELRNYAGLRADGKCDTFLEYLGYLDRTEHWHLPQKTLDAYLTAGGPALFLFDGLDEIFDAEDREHIARQIVGLADACPSAHLLVTSRLIGYRRRILTDAGFVHLTLQDLERPQIETFVKRWYRHALYDRPQEAALRGERMLRSFREIPSIRHLAGNPMLLTIMAIINKHRELPRERWRLYDHAVSVLVEHWDVNKHLHDENLEADYLDEEDKKELLRRLALSMQAGREGLAGNYIHRDDLERLFAAYLTARYDETPPRAVRLARAMIDRLRRRNFILSLYGANLYGFVHRAFLEYFCAGAILNRFEKTRELSSEQLKQQVYGGHLNDTSWHEVLRLICGMVDERFAGEIIDYLVAYRKGLPRMTNEPWHLALAVQCLAEVRNPGVVAEPARRLLAAVCALLEPHLGVAVDMEPDTFLREQIVLPAARIGSRWPHREDLAEWLRARKQYSFFHLNRVMSTYAPDVAAFIGHVGEGEDAVRRELEVYLNHGEAVFRFVGVIALASGWSGHPDTPAHLQRRAVQDASEEVRAVAVRVLAEQYREDPAVLTLVRDRAAHDPGAWVRRHAVRVLAEQYREDPAVRALVRDRAAHDPDEEVRRRAAALLEDLGMG